MPGFSSRLFYGYFYGALCVIIWGVDSIVFRMLAVANVSPFLVASLRLYLGVIILSVFFLLKKLFSRDHYPLKINYNRNFFIAAFCLAINLILFHYGLKYTIASNASLIENFSPVIVLLIGMFFLPKSIRALSKSSIFWIVILGSIGASLMLVNDPKNIIVDYLVKLKGDVIEIFAMVFFAVFILTSNEYMQKEKNHSGLQVTLNMLFFAAIILLPFTPLTEMRLLSSTQWILITLIGCFSTGFAYLFWHIAQRHLAVIPAALLLNFKGAITVLVEALLLGINEFLTWKLLLGTSLMLYASYAAEIMNYKVKIEDKEVKLQ